MLMCLCLAPLISCTQTCLEKMSRNGILPALFGVILHASQPPLLGLQNPSNQIIQLEPVIGLYNGNRCILVKHLC